MSKLILSFVFVTVGAFAHHGWSGYEEKSKKLEGTIEQVKYENPHGTIELKVGTETFHIVLAPTSRMQSRNLTEDMLKVGTKVSVEAYTKVSDPKELRAERITIAGKTVELR